MFRANLSINQNEQYKTNKKMLSKESSLSKRTSYPKVKYNGKKKLKSRLWLSKSNSKEVYA
ncbi:hypothetical protein ACFFLS_18645 [Flavobacterium procerum]|uniref:Uncharacterized protein n=1 Tax=Flavobacterium procerum TaxID=1455569 RepID=A0ABV6BUF0_9FLAO